MSSAPVGGIVATGCVLLAIVPIRRPRAAATVGWIVSILPGELSFLFAYIVVVSTVPSLIGSTATSPATWVAVAVALATLVLLAVVIGRARQAGPVAEMALAAELGARWRTEIDRGLDAGGGRLPWGRILILPWPFRPRDVEREANITYGDHGKENRLDVLRHRSHPVGAPTLVHLHGGHFRRGRKNFESRPLLHHLARHGWTCISANYRLSPTPAQGFPDHLVDVKRVIAWAREHATRYGIDPGTIFLAGSSAGAHLTAMAALTVDDPAFQPGFESADTSIAGGIGLYGYYGSLGDDAASSPLAQAHPDIPPIFVVHGDLDTSTLPAGAREFVDGLRSVSTQPVVYAELHGAQHAFDLFHSIRFDATVRAIEAFTSWVRSRPGTRPPPHPREDA
jgi:acetyl esterase/lipase